MNFKEQCTTIEQCLPVSDFRVQVAKTHNDMLERIAQLERALRLVCEELSHHIDCADCPIAVECNESCDDYWYKHLMKSEGE